MNIRKAVKVLIRYRTIQNDIAKAEREYKALCDEIDWIASIPSPVQQMTGMPGTGQPSHMTENYALRRVELGESYREQLTEKNNRVIELMGFKFRVEDALNTCSIMEETIIRKRWIQHERMTDIAKELHVSDVTAYRYQWKAFDKIEEAFIDEEVNARVDGSELDEVEKERMA